jgi:diguanylate cyclase
MERGVKNPGQIAIIFITLYILSNYCFNFFYKDNVRLLLVGGSIFNTVAPILTGIWLLRPYYRMVQRFRYFWLFASHASFSYAIGNIVEVVDRSFSRDYAVLANVFWLVSILLGLIALIFANSFSFNSSKIGMVQFIFDILIVMVVVISVSWNVIIQPIVTASNDEGLLITLFNLSYPIGNLAMLFAVLSLYYSSMSVFPKKLLMLEIIGFLILFFANMNYLYVMVNGLYQEGSWYEPLFSISLFFIGLSSFYYDEVKEPYTFEKEQDRNKSKFRSLLSLKLMLPYLGVLLVFSLMIIYEYLEINGLVVGSIIATFLIIIRQILTLLQNNDLLKQTRVLNKLLELKVNQRTQELNNKNLELEQTIKKVEFIAYHDSLTLLTNRRYFEEKLMEAMEENKFENRELAILFIDLDRFKFINDTLGHSVGDLLLQKVGQILQNNVGEGNIVSRQGGDEFMILLKNISKQETELVAKSIVSNIENTININGKEIYITSSIGISMFPQNGSEVDTLIKRADIAMYIAKENGKNRYQFFDKSMDENITAKVNLENGLRRAIDLNELLIHYQPKLDCHSNTITGVEALLRWKNREYGYIPPSTFIPLAEETGLIDKIGEWVLREACLQLKKWNRQGLKSFYISVNVSTIQFLQKGFIEKVRFILNETEIDPRYLELEITESAMMDSNQVIPILEQLRKMGIKISVDDFGSGYSSLGHLNKLPIDILKIDRMFIDAIGKKENDIAILSTIITLARSLNLTVIAEGVETELQFNILRERGCDLIQGFYISKPLSVNAFDEEIIRNNKVELDLVM